LEWNTIYRQINIMNITTSISEINKILIDYRGEQAKIWMFDISHTKLAIKVYSKENQEIIYLIILGCKYLKGFFSLNNPKFYVIQYYNIKTSETILKLMDENSDFELNSTAGIALAKGLEQEFGDSFENFLMDK